MKTHAQLLIELLAIVDKDHGIKENFHILGIKTVTKGVWLVQVGTGRINLIYRYDEKAGEWKVFDIDEKL